MQGKARVDFFSLFMAGKYPVWQIQCCAIFPMLRSVLLNLPVFTHCTGLSHLQNDQTLQMTISYQSSHWFDFSSAPQMAGFPSTTEPALLFSSSENPDTSISLNEVQHLFLLPITLSICLFTPAPGASFAYPQHSTDVPGRTGF